MKGVEQMNAVQFDFLKDLLNDAMINARELCCRLDGQPEMIPMADRVLTLVQLDAKVLWVLLATFRHTERRTPKSTQGQAKF